MCVYFGIIFMDFMDNTDFETKQNINDDCTDNFYDQNKQTNKQTNRLTWNIFIFTLKRKLKPLKTVTK